MSPSSPPPTRFGIIGMGGIGIHHAKYLADASIPDATLTAFSSRDPARRAAASALFPAAHAFASQTELLASGLCDAVIICTPHYQHTQAIIEAFDAGLHVLVEKPLAVTLSDARRALDAAQRHPNLLFGIMLNQRSHPLNHWLRTQIRAGDGGGGLLGQLQRLSWTATHWFRPNIYYAASPWRATWAGEGGGLLINQCHHNLDLLLWMTGQTPRRVTAVASLGKRHPIETEDECSAILEYDSGLIAHFYASTGEFPGVNRLEIAGTRARVVIEDDKLTIMRSEMDSRDFIRTATEPFGTPAKSPEPPPTLPAPELPEHKAITRDFVEALRHGRTSDSLLAPAAEDLAALELGHAILLSAVERRALDLPLPPGAYESFLASRRAPGLAERKGT